MKQRKSGRRVALVTGGSRGIGAATVRRLAETGAFVYFTYRRRAAEAKGVRAQVQQAGGEAAELPLELASRPQIDRVVRRILKEQGRCDILVNNAGYVEEIPFEKISDKNWDAMLKASLWGPFALAQRVLPGMRQRGWGRIVNVTSIGGQWGGIRQVHYASAKAGLIGLTKSLAKVASCDGVTSNAVAPGLVITDAARRELDSKSGRDKLALTPIGRFAEPDEIARVICFLASDEAGYITGQTVNVNGGMYFG